jgi:hypothetical protein
MGGAVVFGGVSRLAVPDSARRADRADRSAEPALVRRCGLHKSGSSKSRLPLRMCADDAARRAVLLHATPRRRCTELLCGENAGGEESRRLSQRAGRGDSDRKRRRADGVPRRLPVRRTNASDGDALRRSADDCDSVRCVARRAVLRRLPLARRLFLRRTASPAAPPAEISPGLKGFGCGGRTFPSGRTDRNVCATVCAPRRQDSRSAATLGRLCAVFHPASNSRGISCLELVHSAEIADSR